MTLAIPFAVRTLALFALWMALVDTPHSAELVAGAIAAPLCAALGAAAGRLRHNEVRLRPAFLAPAPRAFVAMFTEMNHAVRALVLALAGRRPVGRFRAVRSTGGGMTPDAAGRRAMIEVLGTLGPNRVVVGIDPDDGMLLVHELLPDEDKPLDPLERR